MHMISTVYAKEVLRKTTRIFDRNDKYLVVAYNKNFCFSSPLPKMNIRGEMKMCRYIFLLYFLKDCICFGKYYFNYLLGYYLNRS